MWNTQLFIDRDGEVVGKHQKIMPTVGERIVHTGGHGDTLTAYPMSFGNLSGLVCGENSNPLAAFTMAAMNAAVDLEDVLTPKLIHDYGGHYNRFDVFSLTINVDAPRALRRIRPRPDTGGGGQPAVGGSGRALEHDAPRRTGTPHDAADE